MKAQPPRGANAGHAEDADSGLSPAQLEKRRWARRQSVGSDGGGASESGDAEDEEERIRKSFGKYVAPNAGSDLSADIEKHRDRIIRQQERERQGEREEMDAYIQDFHAKETANREWGDTNENRDVFLNATNISNFNRTGSSSENGGGLGLAENGKSKVLTDNYGMLSQVTEDKGGMSRL